MRSSSRTYLKAISPSASARRAPESGRSSRPPGYGTPLAEGKECREIDGRHYVLEYPIKSDVVLVAAHRSDRSGNLVYRKTARNFGPIMAGAARLTIVQVSDVVDNGELGPEAVVTPGIYVDRVVVTDPTTEGVSA